AISKGAAGSWQLQNNGYKMIEKDYAPGFFNKHFIKDMKIAKEVMEEKGEDLPILNKVLEMYEELEKNGFGDYGTQSIIEKYE
ncbi:MAG: NAD(P)-dependent oxidoreductase, partial [Clostridium celatum]|nr:NAD(P)-dependent oxidoreductase [Clostridium celatum]